MPDVPDAFPDREDDEAPEIQLFAVTERMEVVGWFPASFPSQPEQGTVAGVDEQWMPSDAMAVLPVNAEATNFMAATPRLAAIAATITWPEPLAMQTRKK